LVDASYSVVTGAATLHDYWLVFVFPTCAGNIIGEISLVAILNHAAIASEIE
jgi:formate-nitrite transporter family protein